MFALDRQVTQVGGDQGAISVAASVALVREGLSSRPALEANRNDMVVRLSFSLARLIPVDVEERLVGVHQGEVLPAVVIVIEQDKSAAVCRIVDPGNQREIGEFFSVSVHEEVVALHSAQGMDDIAAVFLPASLQASVNLRGERGIPAAAPPFLGKAEAAPGEVAVGAHDRAPEVTSQVDLGG